MTLRLKLALIALLLGMMPTGARAQQGNTVMRQFSGAPTGSCANIQIAVNVLTGDFYDCLNGAWNLITGGGGGSSLFSALQTSTNTTATMTVGTGATLTFSGTGINNASAIRSVAITGTPTLGQIPIASSGVAAAWGDPLVTPNFADNSVFTAGSTGVMNIGGVFNDALGAVSAGNAAAPRITSDRMLFINLGKIAGTAPTTAGKLDIKGADGDVFVRQTTGSNLHVAVDSAPTTAVTGTFFQATQPVSLAANVGVTQQTSPWVVSVPTWAGGTLGAMANYGTSPGAVLVPGVNAFITNIPHAIIDTGSTTAVTGNVTVIQGTGTNLHAVLDTTSTTAVTQATAANLNATVVPGGSAIFEVSPTTAANTNANPFFTSLTDGTTKVTVIAGTAALKTDLSSVAGTATSTAASGVAKVGIVGNAAAIFDAANNATVPANSLSIAGVAVATQANPSAVSAGNTARVLQDINGAQYVRLDSPNYWSCGLKALAATLTQCQPAAAAGLRNYVTDIAVTTTTATAGTYSIQTGTGANCVTSTAALYPSTATTDRFTAPATTGTGITMQAFSLHTPLVSIVAGEICVIGVATNTITIQLNGYTAP